MGSRTEQRISVSLPIIVRGVDASGNSFVQAARTHDVSVSGACFEGVTAFCKVGLKVEIESQGQRAWFRVKWIGEPGTMRAGQIGVRCLEPGNCIWNVPLGEWMEDKYDPRHPPKQNTAASKTETNVPVHNWDGSERRYFSRRACRIEAEVRLQDESSGLSARITDISVSGCYIEMLAPLPVDSVIELLFKPGDAMVNARGKIRTSQTGLGMGISFMDMRPGDFQELLRFAPPSRYVSPFSESGNSSDATASGGVPELVQSKREARVLVLDALAEKEMDAATTAEELEAVVRILTRKGLLGRSEIFEEMDRLKAEKANPPPSHYSSYSEGVSNRMK